MVTQPVSTTKDWREMEQRADALVPPDIADHIPMRITDGGSAIRFRNSRITLPVIIGLYRNGDNVDDLNCSYPTLVRDDIQALIDYYNSEAGHWIDEYVELVNDASIAWIDDFHRRCDAGEYPSIKPQATNSAGLRH